MSADIAAFLEDDYENLNVTDFQIIKRATDTDAKSDIVYAEIDFETEKAAHTRQYKMEYGLYNDGWILDNVEPYEEETWACSPLYGMSDEELLEMYSSSINNPIDLQIVLNDTDLENGVQTVEYQYVMEYPFCRVTWKCDEQFLFSKDGESWHSIYSSTGGVPYAIKEDWNITGRWTNSGSYYLEYIDIYSSDLASGTVDLFWHYKDEEERLTAPFKRTQSFAVETGLDPLVNLYGFRLCYLTGTSDENLSGKFKSSSSDWEYRFPYVIDLSSAVSSGLRNFGSYGDLDDINDAWGALQRQYENSIRPKLYVSYDGIVISAGLQQTGNGEVTQAFQELSYSTIPIS